MQLHQNLININQYSQQICENAKRIVKDNYVLAIIIFVCGIFAYGYELSHGTITIDEEIFWDKSTNALKWQCSLGRWSFSISDKLILPNLYFPFTNCIFSLMSLSIAYSIWLNQNKDNNIYSKVILGSLAISFPTLGHMLSFSFMAAQVSLSCALMIFSYILITHNNPGRLKVFTAIVLAEFSIMTYQSILFIPIGLFIIDNYKYMHSHKSIKRLLRIILFILIILILYLTLDTTIKTITHISTPEYLLRQIRWFTDDTKTSSHNLVKLLRNLFTGNNYTYIPFVFLFIPSLIILHKMPNKIYAIFIVTIMYLYLISIFIVFGGEMPARSCLYIPLVYAGFFYIAYNLSSYIGKIIIVLVSIYIFCLSCSINTSNSFLDTLARNRDMMITSRIMNTIYDSYPNYINEAKYVLFFGTCKTAEELGKGYGSKFELIINNNENELFGQSYFRIKSNENGRIIQYMQMLGIDMPWLDSLQKREIIMETKDFKSMPYYPEKGFVKIIDEVLVIKLSP